MSTVEKLFVEFFERRNRILQKVQWQTDSHKQNLASKSIIEGVDPPPWLWNPINSSSDVQKVLNKEELISEIYLPRPQPSVSFSDSRYYICNRSVVQDIGAISDRSFKVTHDCRNVGTTVEQPHAACVEENNAECGINALPEVEISATSPDGEIEPRISEVYATQEQSLVRIQRSKSRQKALEIRTSAKATRKSLRQESSLVGSFPQDTSSLFGNKLVDLVNDTGNIAGSIVVSRESCDADDTNKSIGWKKEIEIVVPSGKSRNATNSVAETMCALDGLETVCSSDKNCTQQQRSKEESRCQGSGNEHMEDVSTFNVTTDSCGICEERAGDGGVDKGNDTNNGVGSILTSSSIQQPCPLNEVLNHNNLDHVTASEESQVPKSVGCLAQLFNDATKSTQSNVVEEPEPLALEMSNSITSFCNHGLTNLPYNSSFGPRDPRFESDESFAKMNEIHSTLIEEAEMPCVGSIMVNCAKLNCAAVNGDELMPINSDNDITLNSRLPSESPRLECTTKSSADCVRPVDPKQLHFDDTGGCNINGMSCITPKGLSQESSAKEISDDLLDPQVFRCNHSGTAQENMLLEERKSFQESEHYVCSPGSVLEVHVKDHLNEYSVSGNHHTTTKASQDNSEVLHFESATPVHQSNNKPIDLQTSSTEHQTGFFPEEGCKFTPELQIEYQRTAEGKEESASLPHALEREHLESDYRAGKDDLGLLGSVGFATGNDKDPDPLKSTEIQYPQKLHSANEYSWQQNKRRKIEDQETSSFSGSPSFTIQLEQINEINLSMNLGGEKETVLDESVPVQYPTDEQIYPRMSCQFTKTKEFSVENISNEGSLYSEVLAENENFTHSPSLNQEVSVLFSFKEIDGLSKGCSLSKHDIAREDQKDGLEDETFVRAEDLIDTESSVLNGYYFNADSRLSDDLAQSSAKIDLEMIGADQTMPVLEGFIMDSGTSNEKLDIPGSETIFNILELPRTSIERASILEQICKSACMQTPFTQMSSSFQLKEMNTCHLSLPNGIEGVNMKSFSTLDGDVYDNIRSRCVDETQQSFHAMTYPDCLPYSKSRYAWDVRNPFTFASPVGKLWEKSSMHSDSSAKGLSSWDVRNPFTFASPVGKLWEKSSMHSDSSGKGLSSNPDLGCFPIEEDPDSSEEIDDISLPDGVEENVVSGAYTCAEREPLADISAVYTNGSSVPVAEECASKCNTYPVATDVCVNQTNNKSTRKVGKLSKSRTDIKENDALLTGVNRMNKSGYSLNNNSHSKKSTSYATGSRTQQRKLLVKETKQNNIVSNVTSFIPMVQEKQAAALCKAAGRKRDVKVKALEAAEAAKRQQEKRDQERMLRKEAMQLERARVERENSRIMKLNKKKNEEQKKKKDTEMAAKKRGREEEERKEKEKKRKRMEEAKSQRLEEGKFVGDKVDKERLPIPDVNNKKKDVNNELQKRKDLSKEIGDHATKLEVNESTLDTCGSSGDSFDDVKVTPAIKKAGDVNSLVQKVEEKSYEISPYQCSDDEDDNYDREKYIPPWARQSCVAVVLPLQKDIKPDDIFPPDSFCSTSEIVVRRK